MSGPTEDQTQLLLGLARIEGKVDVVDEKINGLTSSAKDHEDRIRKLEQRPAGVTPKVLLSTIVGVATIVGAMAPAAAAVVNK